MAHFSGGSEGGPAGMCLPEWSCPVPKRSEGRPRSPQPGAGFSHPNRFLPAIGRAGVKNSRPKAFLPGGRVEDEQGRLRPFLPVFCVFPEKTKTGD